MVWWRARESAGADYHVESSDFPYEDVRWPGVLLIAIGCLNGWLGYLIRYRGQYDLIAGTPRAAQVKVAPWVGGWTMVIGAICVAWGAGTLSFPEQSRILAVLMSGLLLLVIVTTAAGSIRRAK